jgi:hypothetical protein
LLAKNRLYTDNSQLVKSPVGVEKGTKAVILVHFSVSGQPTFNNLQRTFLAETPRKEFFDSHACQLGPAARESS